MKNGRRAVLACGLGSFIAACAPTVQSGRDLAEPPAPGPKSLSAFAAIEADIGGRVGVAALDLEHGTEIGHRADERFAMASTFKWVLAAAVLAATDRGDLKLEEEVAFSEADLLEHAPTTRASIAIGRLSIEALAKAIVVNSDNTAANLLFRRIGGPTGLTSFARAHGDDVTRFDRDEPTLNTNLAGDPRDTTTPRAMARLMKSTLTTDGVLRRESRDRLRSWLIACETGRERLRAGVPTGWTVGDKTGTGERSAINDVAIIEAPGRAPLIVVAFLSESGKTPAELNPAQAAIARAVVAWATR